uniref:CCHC-type domain-containing protein n=1 Tax=Oryzias melastigma TaxID=30732 RepID=A0A3B3D2N0_ORYME
MNQCNHCFKCGRSGHLSRDWCKSCQSANNGDQCNHCFKCGRSGHLSRDCLQEKGTFPWQVNHRRRLYYGPC